jgi:hypothetical protein
METFRFRDLIVDIIPGLFFIWALPLLGPFNFDTIPFVVYGNEIVDSILMLGVVFVIGHLIQFFAAGSVQKILQKFCWEGSFFSEIYLVNFYKRCSEKELVKYLDFALQQGIITETERFFLMSEKKKINSETINDSKKLSQRIYRYLDAKSLDESKAQKAHIKNTFFSFFISMSFIFLAIGLFDVFAFILNMFGLMALSTQYLWIIVFSCGIFFIVFLYQAKKFGEEYVKGLFWSYVN